MKIIEFKKYKVIEIDDIPFEDLKKLKNLQKGERQEYSAKDARDTTIYVGMNF